MLFSITSTGKKLYIAEKNIYQHTVASQKKGQRPPTLRTRRNPPPPPSSRSLARTRKKIRTLIECNQNSFTCFVTWTLRRTESIPRVEANRMVAAGLRSVRRFLPGLKYIGVIELQKRNQWHWHFLMNLPKNLIKNERKTRQMASLWDNGFVDIRPIKSVNNLAGYFGKYLSKSNISGKKTYFSRNLNRPVEFWVVGKENLDRILSEGQYIKESARSYGFGKHLINSLIYKKHESNNSRTNFKQRSF